MKERSARLKIIRKLIRNNRIESQDVLLKELQKEGFDVTQATLSRDLKLLKVGKISDGHSGYVYSLQSDEDRGESETIYVQDFLRGYVSIDWNTTTVVIKTFAGYADPVSNAIDYFNMDEILGTVAGDSCVFAALKDGCSGEDFMRALKKHIPDLED